MTTFDEILASLKVYLKQRKSAYVTVDEWCGDTEAGFWDEEHFDMDALLNEIDLFGDMLREHPRP